MPLSEFDSKVILALTDWNWMSTTEIATKTSMSRKGVRNALTRLMTIDLVTIREIENLEYNLTSKGSQIGDCLTSIEQVLKKDEQSQ